VYQEYIETGKSAHTDDIKKRPVFKQAIDDALEGKYDVLVVHKIDRFSLKLRITLEYFEKLGKAGICFVSIENCDSYPQMGTMLKNWSGWLDSYPA
jgi:site-specific DNA recombinase